MPEKELRIKGWCKNYPSDRPPRFLKAFLLLFLLMKETHGYDLIEQLKKIGVQYETYEIGYVYKTLRNMEKEGDIESRWDVKDKGAAKRIYRITEKGKKTLAEWAGVLENMRDSISSFLEVYESLIEVEKD